MQTTIILVIPAAALAFFFIFYYNGFAKKPKNETPNDPESKRLAQNKLNTKSVLTIIKGDVSNQGDPMLSHYEVAFDKWQETQFSMVNHASHSAKELFFNLERGNDPYVCHAKYSEEKPDNDYVLFMENCFTEPFPSTHDMDDHAVNQFIWQILLLKGIDEESSRDLYFFQKAYFVNHKIVQAIIVIDIYERD